MRLAIRNAVLFATTAFVLMILADFFAFGLYQGGEPAELRNQLLLTHGLFLFALLGLAMIGSFLAFAIRRNWSPSAKRAAFLGVLYSIVSFFAVVIAFQYGGLIASAAWLVLSAFILALIGTIKRDAHNG